MQDSQGTAVSGMARTALVSGAAAAFYGIALVIMDLAVAQRYGTGPQAAVYQASMVVPAALQTILSGGVLLGTIVPIFIRIGGREGSRDAQRFISRAMLLVTAVVATIVAALALCAPMLAEGLAGGFSADLKAELVEVMRVILPMLVPHAAAFVLAAVLMALGRVGRINALPALVPLAGLASYPWWTETGGALAIACASCLGCVGMVAVAGFEVRRASPSFSLRFLSGSEALREFAAAYASTALAHAAMSLLILVAQSSVGHVSSRELSAFAYATRPVTLGMAFVTTIITAVVLPMFSGLALNADRTEARGHARRMVILVFGALALGAGAAVALAEPIARILYVRGAFTDADAALVAAILRPFVLQAPLYGAGVVCWRILNAYGEVRPLTLASLGALILGAAVIPYCARTYGGAGVAGAYTFVIGVWSLALLIALGSRLRSTAR